MSLLALFRPLTSTAPVQSVHSGMVRLMIYQMQEEALRQYEQKRKKDTEEVAEEVKPAAVPAKAKPKARPRRISRPAPDEHDQVRPFRLKIPAFDPFEEATVQLPHVLNTISDDLYRWYQEFQPLLIRGVEAAQARAANDDDEEEALMMLLEAAA